MDVFVVVVTPAHGQILYDSAWATRVQAEWKAAELAMSEAENAYHIEQIPMEGDDREHL